MARIEGILFDLGDTLLDFGKVDVPNKFEAGARRAYEYLLSLGQPLPPFDKYLRRQLWAIRWNYFKSRLTRREFNALDVLGRLGFRMGHSLSEAQTLELAWLWYEPLSRQAKVEDGAKVLLQEFQRGGLTLGVVSNTFVPGQVLDRHLSREGLLELLPIRIYSCDVGYRKPSTGIFRIALERAGLQADSTMFVGDSPHADIEGANRCGLISVLKDPAGRHKGAGPAPTHRIRQLGELREIIRQYNG